MSHVGMAMVGVQMGHADTKKRVDAGIEIVPSAGLKHSVAKVKVESVRP